MNRETDGGEVARGKVDGDYSFEPVPLSARKGFIPLLFVMLGFTFNSTGMNIGAKMGTGADMTEFILALILGGIFLAVFTGLLAFIGSRTGMTFDQLARRSFGKSGSKFPSLIIAITQIGWFGVCSAMFSQPVADYLGCSPYIVIACAGICMTASAYVGFKGLEIISYIAVPMIIVLGMWSIHLAMEGTHGFSDMFSRHPVIHDLNVLIGMVIGSFISGGCSTPNFTRFAKTAKGAVISTVAAFLLGNSLMLVFGAVGGAVTGKDDIFYVMIAQGLILSAFVVLGANIWTTNDNALYTAGLGLSNIFTVRKKKMVLVGGFVGTVCAFWLYQNFVSWILILSATLPAIGTIIILDYFCYPHKYAECAPEPLCQIPALAGTVLGLLAGNFIKYGNSGVNAIVTAAVVWFVCRGVEKLWRAVHAAGK
ncbi:MAG: cytosine permease [Ruminobacter sp.]|nr:cytosine permease [Ruminobacter sp.]